MKKTLLCFLFLLTTVFHAQVTDVSICAGEPLNLTSLNADFIGNFNPAETTISYHLSLDDALNNTNVIVNPTNYIGAPGTTKIYGRINNNGNITTNYFDLTVFPSINVSASNKPILCKGDSTSLTINVSDENRQYLYSINNSAYTSNNYYDNLPAEIYTIQVLDIITGCASTINYTISTPTALNTTALIDVQTAIITTTGGTIPYQYSLDGINYQASNIFPNLTPGDNTFIVKDYQGCTAMLSATILPALTSVATITKEIDCDSNGSVMITSTGGKAPYMYSINGGATYQMNNTFNNLTAGTYTTTVKDALNTINQTNTITLAPPTSVTAIAVITKATNCGESDTVTISATAGKTPYLYSFDGSNTFTSVNTATGLTAGDHSLFVKDANGCLAPLSVVITPSSSLSATFTTTNPYCSQSKDGKITLTATGGTEPYTYSIGNGYVSSNLFNNLSAGYYNVSVKDAIGCLYTMVAAIVEPTILSMTVSTTNSTTSADDDGTITLNATGGVAPYTYAITYNNGTPPISFQNSTIFTGLKAGSYDVYVKDANGCIYFQTNTITANNPNSLVVSIDVTPVTCNNSTGIITIQATGGIDPYQYSLDNGINYTSSNVFTGLTSGIYNINVRDTNNNTTSMVAVITPVNAPAVSATVNSSVLCKGDNTGSITANVTGGLAPYTYSLDNGPYINGNSSMIFTNLYAGTHNITVESTNGCLTTTQVIISEPATALMTVTTVKNQTITINASGGAGNYRYAISPNLDIFSTNNIFSGLTPGSYIVNTSDVNGCYITMNALVDPPAPLINGQIKLTLEFKPGQTLADLIIDGQNIKWYINQDPLAGKTSKTSEVPLPLTTVIVDGTTYYASQTINGIESTERMAVTVKSNTLGTDDLTIKNFSYYPNPVKNVLTISNTSNIDEVTFISIKGETLLTKKINGLRSEIDLSNFSKGVYFLKIKSEGAEKTVKLIKD